MDSDIGLEHDGVSGIGAHSPCATPCNLYLRVMMIDPVASNPDHYSVLFENERVRVLKYHDKPGTVTRPHDHPDSVMITASSFRRELIQGDRRAEVELPAGRAMWLAAQSHAGHNIGETDTDVFFVELKEPAPVAGASGMNPLGPVG